MNLSDLGASASTSGGTASASAAVPDPAAAISQGSALFDQAYTKAGGSITGTVAVAASIVGDLPAGQAKQLLSTVLGLASGAAAGAAMGSVVPGWGTAVGAAVGAVMGLAGGSSALLGAGASRVAARSAVEDDASSQPVRPSDTEPADLIGEMYAQPASWPDIRIHSPGYQPPFTGTDPATGQSCPVAFTFGTGWVSPPQTTPTSKQAAWYLAQAWLGRGSINKWFALSAAYNGPGDLSDRHQAVAAATEEAGTILGSDALVLKALALVDRWYGTRFGPKGSATPWAFTAMHCKGVNSNFGWTPPAGAHTLTKLATGWQKLAQCLNTWDSLDYAYYFSENLTIRQDQAQQFGGVSQVVIPVDMQEAWSRSGTFFAAMPDTTLVALCELAALVVLQVIPEKGSDHVALHFVMALAWLWRRGQEKDKNLGRPFALKNHENFSRLIGLLAHHVRSTKPPPSKAPKPPPSKEKSGTSAKHPAAAPRSSSTSIVRAAPPPGGAMLLSAAGAPGDMPPGAIVVASPASHTRAIVEGVLLVTAVAGGVLVWTRRR